jgi:hypothetical protein
MTQHMDERMRGRRGAGNTPQRHRPELSLPAARTFMAWALPGLDADRREDLLRSVGSAAKAAYRQTGTATPPWLAELLAVTECRDGSARA